RVRDGLCSRFCLDAYEREVERYGGPAGMTVAEAVFAADSPAVAQLVQVARATDTLDRTTLVVLSTDDLLAGLGLNRQQRLAWYRERVAATSASAKEYRQRQVT